MENEVDIILSYYKQQLICKVDNLNQKRLMNNQIDRSMYEHNRIIIHSVWDNQDKLTLNQIFKNFENLIGLD